MTYFLVIDRRGTVIEETTDRKSAVRAARIYGAGSNTKYKVITAEDHIPAAKFR